ncbi:MAG: sulfotransferase [Acidimicrobiia bacterium]|nr:sulfotransferase [Acidimicrobiia bacterium]MYB72717.1 sulfotransferase [Acidimicrobiia bacterium]MYI00279.1 sulfotransferase [Acidimicrobiia bacterium]
MSEAKRDVRATDKRSLPMVVRALNGYGRAARRIRPSHGRLSADALVSKAQESAKLNDFGPDGWQEGFQILVDSVNDEGNLSQLGRMIIGGLLHTTLQMRLRVVDWANQHPEVAREQVTAPIMVSGLPRTGTTLLSNLLDLDPQNRSLLAWEAAAVAPPPTLSSHKEDPRIAKSVKDSDQLAKLAPSVQAMHPMAPTLPTECVTLLGGEFKSIHFETQGTFDTYGTFFETCDMVPAYEFHRLCLQVLQSAIPTQRWALKTPGHMWHMDAVYAVYPDARVVWTHRDPLKVVGSVASLNSTLHATNTDQVDFARVGRTWRDKCLHGVKVGTEFRDRQGPNDTVFDLQYAELMDDPVGSVERIYRHFNMELDDLGRRRMAAWMDENPQDRFGRHRYTLDQFGLPADEVRDQFAPYVDRYQVPSEG